MSCQPGGNEQEGKDQGALGHVEREGGEGNNEIAGSAVMSGSKAVRQVQPIALLSVASAAVMDSSSSSCGTAPSTTTAAPQMENERTSSDDRNSIPVASGVGKKKRRIAPTLLQRG